MCSFYMKANKTLAEISKTVFLVGQKVLQQFNTFRASSFVRRDATVTVPQSHLWSQLQILTVLTYFSSSKQQEHKYMNAGDKTKTCKKTASQNDLSSSTPGNTKEAWYL